MASKSATPKKQTAQKTEKLEQVTLTISVKSAKGDYSVSFRVPKYTDPIFFAAHWFKDNGHGGRVLNAVIE